MYLVVMVRRCLALIIDRILLFKLLMVILFLVVSYILVFSTPRSLADFARSEYTKSVMEVYVKENSIMDSSEGSKVDQYYLNIVLPEGNVVRKKVLFERSNQGIMFFSALLFVVSLIPLFHYIYGVYFNGYLLLLIAVGYGDIRYLVPMIAFLIGVYARKKLVVFLKDKN